MERYRGCRTRQSPRLRVLNISTLLTLISSRLASDEHQSTGYLPGVYSASRCRENAGAAFGEAADVLSCALALHYCHLKKRTSRFGCMSKYE